MGLVHEWRQKAEGSIYSDVDVVQICCGEERAELDGEAVDFPIDLHSNPHQWSLSVGCDQKNEIVNTSGRNQHL